jgi:enamine deaminase RidA (YjgF/YER057c/UK114 family)
MRQLVASGGKWEALVGYSRAVRVGHHVHVAGSTAAAPDGRVQAAGDAAEQTRIAIRTIERALVEAGASLADVVRTRIYTTDISQWEAIGRAHGEFFGQIRPAATMVEVRALIDPAMLVEIEAEAITAGTGDQAPGTKGLRD